MNIELKVRKWSRGHPACIVIEFTRDITNEEIEAIPRALMTALHGDARVERSPNDVLAIQWLIERLLTEHEKNGTLSAAFVTSVHDKVRAIREHGVGALPPDYALNERSPTNVQRLLNEAAIHFESFPGGRDGNGMALLYRAIEELKSSKPSDVVSQPRAGEGRATRDVASEGAGHGDLSLCPCIDPQNCTDARCGGEVMHGYLCRAAVARHKAIHGDVPPKMARHDAICEAAWAVVKGWEDNMTEVEAYNPLINALRDALAPGSGINLPPISTVGAVAVNMPPKREMTGEEIASINEAIRKKFPYDDFDSAPEGHHP